MIKPKKDFLNGWREVIQQLPVVKIKREEGGKLYPPLPNEDLEEGEVRVWTTKQLLAFADATATM